MATQIDLSDGGAVTRAWHNTCAFFFEVYGRAVGNGVVITPTEEERVQIAELFLYGVSTTVIQQMVDRLRRPPLGEAPFQCNRCGGGPRYGESNVCRPCVTGQPEPAIDITTDRGPTDEANWLYEDEMTKQGARPTAPPARQGEAGRERFYCAEFLRRWACQTDDAGRRGLLANLAYAVAQGQHVDAVVNGGPWPSRADVPSAATLHGWNTVDQPAQPPPPVNGRAVADGFKLAPGWETISDDCECTFGATPSSVGCEAMALCEKSEWGPRRCLAHAIETGALVPVAQSAEPSAPVGFRVVGRSGPGVDTSPPRRIWHRDWTPRPGWAGVDHHSTVEAGAWERGEYLIIEPIVEPPAPPPAEPATGALSNLIYIALNPREVVSNDHLRRWFALAVDLETRLAAAEKERDAMRKLLADPSTP